MRPCLLPFPSAFPASRLVPAALVLLAPAPLAAEGGSLDLRALPPRALPGATLTFQVITRNLARGVQVAVTFQDGGALLGTCTNVLPPSGILDVAWVVPRERPPASVTIRASVGELLSAPIILPIGPAGVPPRSGLGPAAPPASAAPAAPAAPAASMGQVPAAVQTHIATFLGTRDALNFLRVSPGQRIPAGKGIRDFKLQGELRRGHLTGLLARFSQVEALVLGRTPNLRSQELVEAICKLRHLKKLTILSESSLEVAGAVAIARSLAESGFHSLCIHPGPHAMRPDDLAQLPETLQDLQVYGPDLVGPEFGRFSNLQRLTIRASHRFTGRGLPPELRILEVLDCLGFEDGRELPVRLETLRLRHLSQLHGPIHLPALRELSITLCERFTPDLCKATVAAAPNLKNLRSDGLDRAVLEAAPAGLEVLQILEGGGWITDGLLSRFVQLRSLHLPQCSIAGSGLPATLTELDLSNCAEFRTEALNTPSLRTLTLYNCPAATGTGLPAQLGRLKVSGCDAFPLSAVTHAPCLLDSLRSLDFWTRNPELATPEDVARLQPRLSRMDCCCVEVAGGVKFVDHNLGRR